MKSIKLNKMVLHWDQTAFLYFSKTFFRPTSCKPIKNDTAIKIINQLEFMFSFSTKRHPRCGTAIYMGITIPLVWEFQDNWKNGLTRNQK